MIDKSNIKKYHMINSSMNALDICDKITKAFIEEEISFVNIYGLLQGLFVGIDALYSLSYAINGNKYMVNINSNDILRQIKYIRNDCVGHPTNREYSSSLGYCYLDDEISKEKISYVVYRVKSNKEVKNNYDVNLLKTIDAFNKEKNNILNALEKSYKNTFKMSNYILSLYNNPSLISEVKEEYINCYNNSSYDRFIWRLDIIESLSNKTDEISKYLLNEEISKVYKMCCNIEKVKPIIKTFKMPKIIVNYIRFLKANKIKYEYSNDSSSNDFNRLLEDIKNSDNQEIYNYLLENRNDKNIIYAFDKMIRGNLWN